MGHGQRDELIPEVLNKLDMMPSQVLIEGTVLEVTLKNNLRYGLKYLIEAGEFSHIHQREALYPPIYLDLVHQ